MKLSPRWLHWLLCRCIAQREARYSIAPRGHVGTLANALSSRPTLLDAKTPALEQLRDLVQALGNWHDFVAFNELAALNGAGGAGETWLEEEAAALDESRGLYRKYYVKRLRDESGKHRDCTYFVLDEVHDKFTGAALRAYADACESEFPQLAAELRSRHPAPPPQQPGVSGEREAGCQEYGHRYKLATCPECLYPRKGDADV